MRFDHPQGRGRGLQRSSRTKPLTVRHAILAFAPLVGAYLVAAERVTLGGSLDLLWMLLTVAAVIHCLQQRVSGASRPQQLLSLALVLALLFPVISLDDDRAQEDLPGELQSLISAPAKQKSHAPSAVHAPALAAAPQPSMWLNPSVERVAPAPPAARQCAWRQASGNHSPPSA